MSKNEPNNLYLRRSIFIGGDPYPRGAILDPAKNKHLTDKVVRDLIASAAVERTDRKPRAKPPEPRPEKPEGGQGAGQSPDGNGGQGEGEGES
ncbi:hypothetical protein [Thioalkalivibrio sp. ALE6]|uniref:hypothetical protein n=1 Tax=Thioalkalivibrio sp. ALE6 TaxID=1266908 RepID=UPI00037A85E1|nr:hypothetical protein [Thioalkalivibrio sp. ALE6]